MKYKTIPYAPYIIKVSEPKKTTLSDEDLQDLADDLAVNSILERKHFGDISRNID